MDRKNLKTHNYEKENSGNDDSEKGQLPKGEI